MFKPGTVLKTTEQFGTAMVQRLQVAVYQQGEIISPGGLIQDFDNVAVKINGAYFMRANCDFRVR